MKKKKLNNFLAKLYFCIFKISLKLNCKKLFIIVLSTSYQNLISSKEINLTQLFESTQLFCKNCSIIGSGYIDRYYYLNIYQKRKTKYYQIRFIRERYLYDEGNVGRFGLIPVFNLI